MNTRSVSARHASTAYSTQCVQPASNTTDLATIVSRQHSSLMLDCHGSYDHHGPRRHTPLPGTCWCGTTSTGPPVRAVLPSAPRLHKHCALLGQHEELHNLAALAAWPQRKQQPMALCVLLQVCNHQFHSECLQKWGDTSCPVCRCAARSRCHGSRHRRGSIDSLQLTGLRSVCCQACSPDFGVSC